MGTLQTITNYAAMYYPNRKQTCNFNTSHKGILSTKFHNIRCIYLIYLFYFFFVYRIICLFLILLVYNLFQFFSWFPWYPGQSPSLFFLLQDLLSPSFSVLCTPTAAQMRSQTKVRQSMYFTCKTLTWEEIQIAFQMFQLELKQLNFVATRTYN